MKIKLGIELCDQNFIAVDASMPENGNPGIGGSEYLFALLGRYLQRHSQDFEITFFHYTDTRLPDGTGEVLVRDNMEMLEKADSMGIDILIHQVAKSDAWYKKLAQTRIKDVPWAHCFLEWNELQAIKACDNVKRVVFVGKEEYDSYIDDDVIFKSSYIYNMINTKREIPDRTANAPAVTYVGSLVPAKGFHMLAKIWPRVIEAVPNAQLNVIGTGKVYDRNATLGKYGIAQASYEDAFMPYLIGERGDILPSVHFLGLLGEEKEEVFLRTAVGVANPTALTETFCISAVEMELCGVPVVSRNKWGLLDTVKNGETGYLFDDEDGFVDSLVKLLKDSELNERMGKAAREFVKNTFEAEDLIQSWIKLFKEVYEDIPATFCGIQGNWSNDFKYLRGIIRILRIKLGLRVIPSVEDLKYYKNHLRH